MLGGDHAAAGTSRDLAPRLRRAAAGQEVRPSPRPFYLFICAWEAKFRHFLLGASCFSRSSAHLYAAGAEASEHTMGGSLSQ